MSKVKKYIVWLMAGLIVLIGVTIGTIAVLNKIKNDKSGEVSTMQDDKRYSDLDAKQEKAIALAQSGDSEGARRLAADNVAEAERSGDNEKVYWAKTYQAIVYTETGDKQKALDIYLELLNMDVEQEKLSTLYYIVAIYRELGDGQSEQKYLQQYIEMSDGKAPAEYSERLEELKNA
ncbi:MAG: hypothetical protein LBH36_02355 [Candidatus Nomurabacteria bacterium]|nr:hypothetical protein [Candidatus Nomurabacteria bacterium]